MNHLEAGNPDMGVDGYMEFGGSVVGVVLNLKRFGKRIRPARSRVLFIK